MYICTYICGYVFTDSMLRVVASRYGFLGVLGRFRAVTKSEFCAYVYMCIYVHMYTCIHVYFYISICEYVCIYSIWRVTAMQYAWFCFKGRFRGRWKTNYHMHVCISLCECMCAHVCLCVRIHRYCCSPGWHTCVRGGPLKGSCGGVQFGWGMFESYWQRHRQGPRIFAGTCVFVRCMHVYIHI